MEIMKLNWSPCDYEKSAVIAEVVGSELLSRLDWLTIQPEIILDLGCATGKMSMQLQQRFPAAQMVSIDNNLAMLEHAQKFNAIKTTICTDASILPFKNNSVDLIFANLLLAWQTDFAAHLQEWQRVLRSEGVMLLSVLGLDTLKQLQAIFPKESIPNFIDMHDMGDLLLQLGWLDPVLDVNHYTLNYADSAHLLEELQASGMWFPTSEMKENVLNQKALSQEVTFEIIFAHAFAPDPMNRNVNGEVRIPLSKLKRK